MKSLDHWQFDEPHEVLWFNRHGHGPFPATVVVYANVHPSTHYPEARISFGQHGKDPKEMDFGGVLMTVPQAIEHVKQMKTAIAAVLKACPSLAVPVVSVEDLDD